MMTFIGEYKAKLDDKGRLVFPSAFKTVMPSDEPIRLVIKKDLFAPCLNIFTYEAWVRESEDVLSKLNLKNREHQRLWRGYMSGRTMVTPDEKFGRISIPRQMLDSIGVEKEVIFSGNDFKIELWAKEAYEAEMIPDDEMSALVEKILGQ